MLNKKGKVVTAAMMGLLLSGGVLTSAITSYADEDQVGEPCPNEMVPPFDYGPKPAEKPAQAQPVEHTDESGARNKAMSVHPDEKPEVNNDDQAGQPVDDNVDIVDEGTGSDTIDDDTVTEDQVVDKEITPSKKAEDKKAEVKAVPAAKATAKAVAKATPVAAKAASTKKAVPVAKVNHEAQPASRKGVLPQTGVGAGSAILTAIGSLMATVTGFVGIRKRN